MATNLGVWHSSVLIPRPRLADGRVLVRGTNGMQPSKPDDTDLSPEICAVCGYGLTGRQQAQQVSHPEARHRAIPLAELEVRRYPVKQVA